MTLLCRRQRAQPRGQHTFSGGCTVLGRGHSPAEGGQDLLRRAAQPRADTRAARKRRERQGRKLQGDAACRRPLRECGPTGSVQAERGRSQEFCPFEPAKLPEPGLTGSWKTQREAHRLEPARSLPAGKARLSGVMKPEFQPSTFAARRPRGRWGRARPLSAPPRSLAGDGRPVLLI